ncbi:hypothetical protein [Rhodoferax sp. OV413]|uniref:hypothetical protein n=1 Tax=Rhodoferax sp. OV413 TaxID=1855285 RepID=UPI0015A07193|nr:hypothetical protein [Rhodoferax sp. OV413]
MENKDQKYDQSKSMRMLQQAKTLEGAQQHYASHFLNQQQTQVRNATPSRDTVEPA